MLRAFDKLPIIQRSLIDILLLAIWSWALFEAFDVFVIERQLPVTIIEQDLAYNIIIPGGTLQLKTDIVRLRPCEEQMAQSITDYQNVRFDLPPVILPDNLPIGYDSFKRSIDVPRSMAPGPAVLTISTRFNCHWSHLVWPLVRPIRVINFTVIANPGDKP